MATVYLATDLRLERRVAIKVMHGHLADDTMFKSRFVQEAALGRAAGPSERRQRLRPGPGRRHGLPRHGVPARHHPARPAAGVRRAHARSRRSTSWRPCSPASPPRTRPASCTATSSPRTCCSPTTAASRSATSGSPVPPRANTATGAALLGTIAYLSPELVTRGIADARSDIYALGIMMYEMLTGEQPYKGEQPMQIAYQHANDSVPPPERQEPRRSRASSTSSCSGRPRSDPDDRPARRPGDARAAARDRAARSRSRCRWRDAVPATGDAARAGAPAEVTDAPTQVIGDRRRTGAPSATSTMRRDCASSPTRRRRGRGLVAVRPRAPPRRRRRGDGLVLRLRPGIAWSPSRMSSVDAPPRGAVALAAGLRLAVVADRRRSTQPTSRRARWSRHRSRPSEQHVDKGSTVTVLVSKGPAADPGPEADRACRRTTADDAADSALEARRARSTQFDADDRRGHRDRRRSTPRRRRHRSHGGDRTYDQGMPSTLWCRSGPLPDVSGKTVERRDGDARRLPDCSSRRRPQSTATRSRRAVVIGDRSATERPLRRR